MIRSGMPCNGSPYIYVGSGFKLLSVSEFHTRRFYIPVQTQSCQIPSWNFATGIRNNVEFFKILPVIPVRLSWHYGNFWPWFTQNTVTLFKCIFITSWIFVCSSDQLCYWRLFSHNSAFPWQHITKYGRQKHQRIHVETGKTFFTQAVNISKH